MKVIQVKVKANARHSSFEKMEEGHWLAQVKSPPVDGKANKEVLALVARHFKVKKSAVVLKSGERSSNKRILIPELSES